MLRNGLSLQSRSWLVTNGADTTTVTATAKPGIASQVSTAAGLCAVLDLVLTHPERRQGLVTQESFRLPDILANRFGHHLAAGGSKDISGDVVVSGAPGRQRSRAG